MRSTDARTLASSVGALHCIHAGVGSTDQYACQGQRKEPLFVLLSEEETRRFYLHRFEPLRSPQHPTFGQVNLVF